MGAEVKSMDIKKTRQVEEQTASFKRAQEFVAEIKNEIKLVTRTDRQELIFYTKIVVLTTFVFGLSIYGLDLFIQTILSGLSHVLQLISG